MVLMAATNVSGQKKSPKCSGIFLFEGGSVQIRTGDLYNVNVAL